ATTPSEPIRARGGAQTGPQQPGGRAPARHECLLHDRNRWGLGVDVGPFAPLIILDAEIFDDFAVRIAELCRIRDFEWFGERSRIVDGHHTLKCVVVGAREALDEVKLLGMWCSCAVEPELVVEPD